VHDTVVLLVPTLLTTRVNLSIGHKGPKNACHVLKLILIYS